MNQLALNTPLTKHTPGCTEVMTMAEQELAAFSGAVSELFGSEQAKLSAEDWLQELVAINSLPASNREWRLITIKASARLASRVNTSSVSSPSQTLTKKLEPTSIRRKICVYSLPAPQAS
jgi:hypothetical protein